MEKHWLFWPPTPFSEADRWEIVTVFEKKGLQIQPQHEDGLAD